MKSNFLFIVLLILFGSHSFAQEKIEREFNSIITFSSFSPIVYYAPRWNIGYIRKIDKKYWLGLELGYGSKDISVNFAADGGWIKNDYKIFEIKPELYFDLRPNSKQKHLLSVEFQYVNHTDKFNNSWYFDLNDKTYYNYDFADYKRIKYGINLNYNLIFNITTNLALMPKIGIGYRKRVVQYSNIVNRIEDEFFEEEGFVLPDFNGFLRDNGDIGGFNFNLDLRIIYKL
ncbi:hypothetical protein WFZ85_15410 [Flavobacterium sp. j3]|uniref:Outer membrane protein beta-barrel domain-containing protein n=1 Tax=Flavobacterium aureirubrum TaxID=3133147 RepID=A0ABU9N8I8_9FLAO